jgi:amino acid adenylation domain-containing protein
VASLLAVLKAGGAFVPLDPSYPETRRAWIARDSGLSVLVTSESLERPLGDAGSNVPLLLLETAGEALARLSEEAPEPAASPGNLAYVIYTSGTTGNPKGVMVEHRQWMYTLGVSAELYGVTPADSMACMASFSFDISLLELGLPLVTGGRVLLLRREEVLDAARLVDRLEPATLMNAVPSLQRSLIERLCSDSRRLGALRMAFVGGEAVERELLVQMREAFAPARVVVLYGPTEATLICAGHEIAPEGHPAGRRVGAPLPGVELRMVDRAGFLTPLGVGGELWVGGPLVSRGYLGRPELTADRFRPAAGGERFYRTGDLVRYANDGTLEFLGRFDDQVKVRGFRIELGEIESALLAYPGVDEAVVVVRLDGGESRLVAFVTGGEPEVASLREHVSRTLPAHMVPSLFVVLESMPLLPNGKVDRRNLAQRDPAALQAPGERLAPRTPTEELMANLWSEVLKREQVGVNESFFELGGHSLMATQLMSRVRNAFGLELPLRALFERPTVAGLSRAVEEAQRTEQGRLAPPIVPAERAGDLPLSFAQERLWFLDQLEPGRTTYNMPLALRVEGPLSVAVLARSLAGLAARQEALRTRFASRGGRPVQVIDPPGPVSVPVVELEGLQPEAREAEVRRLAAEERERPFDLERGPLMRVLLLRLAAGEWGLLFTLHHAVSDAWSMGVLVREVSALYSGFSRGEEPVLPALPIQYADFAAWQRSWLSGEVLERETGFWRQQLAGVPPVLDLPLDRPRPRVQVLRGARRSAELAPGLAESLRTLAKRQGVTLFMLLLASWQALLARWSGSERLAVGAPIAGRNRLETEGLIGFFINTLVLPADLSGEPGFLDLLSRCREVCLGAFAHQDLPFEKLVEELQPERSLAHSPLFQVAFALQNTPSEALEVPDLRLTPLVPAEARESGLKFDLDLVMGDRQGRLAATLGYNQTLFDGATAARLLGGLVRMLEGLARDPGARVAELPLLSEEEWRQAVSEWGWSAPAPAPSPCFHETFAAHAARAPEAVALEMDGREWSYGELNRRANRLAHRLRELGVGPETRVGVCLERSAELVASLLAVLKAGGAFVPLDPSYPEARRAWIAGDAALSVLVTSRAVERPLGEASGAVRVLTLEAEDDVLSRLPETDPEPVSSPDHLAYLIYTSGSTGLPKGVMVEHRSWSHTLAAAAQRFGPGPGDRMACLASFSFDISLLELGLPLLAGGRVLLVGREEILDMARLADRLAAVTLLHGVPSLMRPLVEQLRSSPRSFADLRTVFVGGEAVDGELLSRMREAFAPARLVVLYGPTESTIIGSSWEVSPEGEPAGRRLGRPLPGVELHVMDRAGLLAPLGAAGELWIGGPGVSRGYLGRPDLTADRFRPGAGGERSYRTGDLARHAGDGTLEFLGRVDAQVKVRGFRVEPGEIESVLLTHPRVREAAVGVRAEGGDTRLVAFVSGEEPEAPSLREHVSRRLPSHMVPSQFVILESLPLLPNGKVDRRSLDRRDPGAPQVSGEWLAPRTPTEDLMAELWSEVLKRERVGVNDNFFELGGHSLLATQLISRVRGAFGLELPLRALFERPTVAGLARAVEEARQSGQASPAPPIVPVERAADLPLSFAQERLWFQHQLEPDSLVYNLPTAVRVSGDLDVAVLWRSLSEIERRHEALRTTFDNVDGKPFQRIHPAPFCAWPVIDLSGLPADRREPLAVRLAEQEARIPFDLDRGPLLRFGLVRLEPREHVALLTMHHAISDRWSMGIFFRELKALYDAFGEGRTSPLPELPVQYPDYSHWQRQWLSGEVLEAQVAHWREELAGAPAVLDLPTDRPRVPVPVFQGDRCAFRLSRETSNALRGLSRGEGVTLFMAVLAVFQTLLARVSNTGDVSVGTPIAGRGRLEIERLIGFFVNTLVLRGRLEDGPGFRDLLRRTREATLRAYEHQDLPFEKLVEELRPARSLAHTPLFQAMLVFQNASRESLPASSPASSLTLSPLEGQSRDAWAQFDLTLVVQEEDEELSGSLQYRRSLFDESTVRRLLTLFERLVEAGVADPDRSLAEAELVREQERRQVVQGTVGAASAEPGSSTVVRRIAGRAAQAPGAPAVLSAAATLGYGEMERRSNQLAHLLIRRGCGRGTLVGLHMERSPEMIVALLAILKAGAAYLPLDPAYPRHRLELMLRDSGAGLVLTQERLLAGLSTDGLPIVCLDREADALGRESAGMPGDGPEPVDLAYVIYTSGSTGTPKGTLLRHLGLDNTVSALVRSFEIGPGDRVLQFASMSFDAAVAEIFVALCGGAAVCLVERESAMPGEDLARRMREMEVSFATLPPSVLAVTPSEDLPRLRTLVAVGEALPMNVAERWAAGRRFVNGYGPTEVTVCATKSDGLRLGRQHPGIGHPIANVEVALLDARGLLVPTGVAGELCVGGVGLAVGYLNRPGLTAERFIPDPFCATPGGRLYRTGDLARQLEDGSFEFLGRVDRQVKVRGFRIELEEVEAALVRYPGISQAAVVTRERGADDVRLIAYVASAGEVSTAGLRSFLESELPAYMIPSTFVPLAELPLTRNGKLDRDALPEPREEAGTALPAAGSLAPRDELEARLTRVWQELLGVQPVGVRDNFFEFGGHSLLAVQLISRVEQETGHKLPLSILFQAPTVEAMANAIRARQQGLGLSCLVPIQPKGSLAPLFLTHPVGGNLFCYRSLVREIGGDRPVYGLQSVGLDGEEAPYTTVADMAAHYLEELKKAQPEGPYHLCGWSSGGVIAYEVAQQLKRRGDEVATLVLIDTRVSDEADRSITRDPALLLNLFALDFGLSLDRFQLSWDEISELTPYQQLSYILDAAKAEGAVPPEIEVDQVLRYFQVFKTNLEAMTRYQPKPYAGRMLLMRTRDPRPAGPRRQGIGWWGQLLSRAGYLRRHLRLKWQLLFNPAQGWDKLAREGVEVVVIPGSHFSILQPPHSQGLAERLREILAKGDRPR